MTDARIAAARDFVRTSGWDPAALTLIAGDASNRKYYRIATADTSVLLMDAPPEKGEDVRPFVRIAAWLNAQGLSAPRIFAEDVSQGFLILEDFGDAVFARLVSQGQGEKPLYAAAIDVLVHLHRADPPDLPKYGSERMAEMAGLAVTWYQAGSRGTADAEQHAALVGRMACLLAPLDADLTCLAQRDYHAENLIWLPEREGPARVGLLDFQDAMIGHPAYDLVSILQDARRDVRTALAEDMRARYVAATRTAAEPFERAYHLLGLQRNLRILGVFTRLCLREWKPGYLPLIPRVWAHVEYNLAQLGDADLTAFVTNALPAPTGDTLARIAAACPVPSPSQP